MTLESPDQLLADLEAAADAADRHSPLLPHHVAAVRQARGLIPKLNHALEAVTKFAERAVGDTMTTERDIPDAAVNAALTAYTDLWGSNPAPTHSECMRAALAAASLFLAGEGVTWRRDEPPLEQFVLVRPVGLHSATGEPFTPTVAQSMDWSGTRRWYTPMNEIEPIEFGESIDQNGLPDFMKFHGTEWRYLPDDAPTALSAPPPQPEVEGLVEALEELIDSLTPAEHVPPKDPAYGDEVRELGKRIGFGALMASASYEWRAWLAENGHPLGSEFVAGPCRSVLAHDLRVARAALASTAVAEEAEPVAWWYTRTDIDDFLWPWTVTQDKALAVSYTHHGPLYAHPSTAPAAAVIEAATDLLARWREFEASVGNQEEAYYKLAKYARPSWVKLAEALPSQNAQGGQG